MDLEEQIFSFLTRCIKQEVSVFEISKYFTSDQMDLMDQMIRSWYLKQTKVIGLNLIKPKNRYATIVPENDNLNLISDPSKDSYKYKTLIYYFEKISNNYRYGIIQISLSNYIENKLFGCGLRTEGKN